MQKGLHSTTPPPFWLIPNPCLNYVHHTFTNHHSKALKPICVQGITSADCGTSESTATYYGHYWKKHHYNYLIDVDIKTKSHTYVPYIDGCTLHCVIISVYAWQLCSGAVYRPVAHSVVPPAQGTIIYNVPPVHY